MGMDPPRARYITPLEGQFSEWVRMLNLKHIGVRLDYAAVSARDIEGMMIVKSAQMKAEEKTRQRRAQEDRAKANRGKHGR